MSQLAYPMKVAPETCVVDTLLYMHVLVPLVPYSFKVLQCCALEEKTYILNFLLKCKDISILLYDIDNQLL